MRRSVRSFELVIKVVRWHRWDGLRGAMSAGETFRYRLRLALVSALLVAMVVIPIVQLNGRHPARFAWQMFSKQEPLPDYTAVLSTGERLDIDVWEYLGSIRSDIDIDAVLPLHLCTQIDGARSIVIGTVDDGFTVSCP